MGGKIAARDRRLTIDDLVLTCR